MKRSFQTRSTNEGYRGRKRRRKGVTLPHSAPALVYRIK